MEVLHGVYAWLASLDVGMLSLVVAAGLDLSMRLFKTDKPYSLIRKGSVLMNEAGLFLQDASKTVNKAAEVVDKIVPDRVK